jgi:hypothetical protein
VSKKLPYKTKAKDLYVSTLFKYNLEYARSLNPDKIFILSAKYGLVNLEREIEPYDKTLKNMPSKEIKKWADYVIDQIKKEADLKEDEFIFLAGERYRKHLLPYISNYQIPLEGLGIGEQLQYLKKRVSKSEKCKRLHQWFNSLERINFPFDERKIPLNGIYILFEKGEIAHNMDRIVRIGSHRGDDRLRLRLEEHFINENKDRSVFRKNIGRALLNKDKDPFLNQWEIDLTTTKSKEKYASLIDFEKQKEIEKKVSQYIQKNISFAVIEMEDLKKRHELESKIVSTISLCNECSPSSDWLGSFSPKEKIRKNGLWLENQLHKEPLSEEDMQLIKNLVLHSAGDNRFLT